ncbi:MAG: hypothetical protein JSV68_08185 [Anaerolineaceae bacterium]|nr:MAG: hypothetical protein JSV68_08185 [Anaerolineaceae bacterium]
MPPRSTRTKKVVVHPNRQILREGFAAFQAQTTTQTKGGGNSTTAILTVSGIPYYGTSESVSHAEMDALNKLLIAHGGSLDDIISHNVKTVACTAKPCCYRCSIVLGLLRFKAATDSTKKTESGMGSTQWVLPRPLSEKITERYGDIVTLLDFYSNVREL